MKKIILMMAVAAMAIMSFSSCERVDAGHEGILVNLYGSDKGVNDVSLVTGMVWGAMGWGINYSCDEIRFGNTPKWCEAIQNFLLKKV